MGVGEDAAVGAVNSTNSDLFLDITNARNYVRSLQANSRQKSPRRWRRGWALVIRNRRSVGRKRGKLWLVAEGTNRKLHTHIFLGVPGELNRGQARDPHHGDPAEEEFHPLVSDDDSRTDEEIEECLREFAKNYSGRWRWFLGWGQNCHTFQTEALKHCRLVVPDAVRKTKL